MRCGLNITDYTGKWQSLSKEVYEIIDVKGTLLDYDGTDYKAGTRVRLITGVMNSPVLGYHTDSNWLTVCRNGAWVAEFVGFEKSRLKLIK